MARLRGQDSLRGWTMLLYLYAGVGIVMGVFEATGMLNGSDLRSDVGAWLGLVLTAVLIGWDPMGRILGPKVQRPPRIEAALSLSTAGFLAVVTAAGISLPWHGILRGATLLVTESVAIVFFLSGVMNGLEALDIQFRTRLAIFWSGGLMLAIATFGVANWLPNTTGMLATVCATGAIGFAFLFVAIMGTFVK